MQIPSSVSGVYASTCTIFILWLAAEIHLISSLYFDSKACWQQSHFVLFTNTTILYRPLNLAVSIPHRKKEKKGEKSTYLLDIGYHHTKNRLDEIGQRVTRLQVSRTRYFLLILAIGSRPILLKILIFVHYRVLTTFTLEDIPIILYWMQDADITFTSNRAILTLY